MDRAGSIVVVSKLLLQITTKTLSQKKRKERRKHLFVGSFLKGTNEPLIEVCQMYYLLLPVIIIYCQVSNTLKLSHQISGERGIQ